MRTCATFRKQKADLFRDRFLFWFEKPLFSQETYLAKEGETDDGNESEQERHAYLFVLLLLLSCLLAARALSCRTGWISGHRIHFRFHRVFLC